MNNNYRGRRGYNNNRGGNLRGGRGGRGFRCRTPFRHSNSERSVTLVRYVIKHLQP